MEVAEQYDRLSNVYDERFRALAENTWRAGILKVAPASLFEGAKIVDLACGTGVGADMLRPFSPKLLAGLDVSERMLAKAQGRYCKLVRADLRALPPSIARYDVATCGFDSLNHLNLSQIMVLLNRLAGEWRIAAFVFDIIFMEAAQELVDNGIGWGGGEFKPLFRKTPEGLTSDLMVTPELSTPIKYHLPERDAFVEVLGSSPWVPEAAIEISDSGAPPLSGHHAFWLTNNRL